MIFTINEYFCLCSREKIVAKRNEEFRARKIITDVVLQSKQKYLSGLRHVIVARLVTKKAWHLDREPWPDIIMRAWVWIYEIRIINFIIQNPSLSLIGVNWNPFWSNYLLLSYLPIDDTAARGSRAVIFQKFSSHVQANKINFALEKKAPVWRTTK